MRRRLSHRALFPAFVAQHSLTFDPHGDPELEAEVTRIALPPDLERAAQKRKLEFLAGRHCAREALRALVPDRTPEPIAIADDRGPRWPPGFVGSISHSHGVASAAVARCDDARAIGLDIEILIPEAAANEIRRTISTPREIVASTRALDWSERLVLTVIFSAKETIFKCLYPLVRRNFGFHAVEVTAIDPRAGTFAAHVLAALSHEFQLGTTLDGRFAFDGERVHTGMILPRFERWLGAAANDRGSER